MASARINRRRILQGVAGGLAVPALGTALAPARRASAQAVELEFWTARQRPGRQQDHYRSGRGLQQDHRPGEGDPRQHPHQAGHRRRLCPVHDGNDLLRLPRRGDDLRLLPRRLLGRQRLHPAARRVRGGGGHQGGRFLPHRLDDDQLRRPHLGPAAGVRLQPVLVEHGHPRRRAAEDHRRARHAGPGVHHVRRRRQSDAGRASSRGSTERRHLRMVRNGPCGAGSCYDPDARKWTINTPENRSIWTGS